MIRNIVFDLGGVVIGRGFDRCGAGTAAFAFIQGDRPFPEWWKRYDLGTATREEVVEAISAEAGIAAAEASAALERLKMLFDEFPDTVRLIEELHEAGYGLYVLSNMPADFYEYFSGYDVFRCFDGQIISSREHLAKPDPRIFGLLSERYGIEPAETLFVDDKPSNTSAAAALGFRVHTFVPGREGCDAVRRIVYGGD